MQLCVPESHVPVCPPARAGQSASAQQPPAGTHIAAAVHFFMVDAQVKSQAEPSQAAVAPAGGAQGSHRGPQVSIELFDTHVPEHTC